MTDNTDHTPTKEECWAEFREVMSGVLVDLYRSGWRAPSDQPDTTTAA